MSSQSDKVYAPEKVYVLLSGGVDSTTALALAKEDFPTAEFETISIDYGQRHLKEIEAAKAIADHYNVEHHTIDAKGFMEGMLVDKGDDNEAVPDVSYDELPEGISPTYVTFRNGLMISIVAARAQAWVMAEQKKYEEEKKTWGIEEFSGNPHNCEPNAYIYVGIHADDGANWAYPDCTMEFAGPMAAAVYVGTYNRVRVRTPFTFLSKGILVGIGHGIGVPYGKTWSCYKGEELHCGTCPTCRSRKDAFKLTGLKDPTKYAV